MEAKHIRPRGRGQECLKAIFKALCNKLLVKTDKKKVHLIFYILLPVPLAFPVFQVPVALQALAV